MNVTPRNRARQQGDLWRLECGICSHVFQAEIPLAARMKTRCPNCSAYNVWNEPSAAPPAVEPA